MDKNRIKHIIYYVFWVVICLGIIGAATYPFISDYLLAQKQMQQIERFDKKDSKT
ncbi:class C sortase, partial [Lactobacillus salivarius]|nr:class C sortase [Ligilactobacillus salivarius]